MGCIAVPTGMEVGCITVPNEMAGGLHSCAY